MDRNLSLVDSLAGRGYFAFDMAKSSSSSDLSIEEIVVSLDRLDADALELVVNAIGVILQERQLASYKPEAVEAERHSQYLDRVGIGANGSHGYIESKFIKGYGPYRYLRLRKNGIHHSFYLGKKIINDKQE
jgi:hypothetical protein